MCPAFAAVIDRDGTDPTSVRVVVYMTRRRPLAKPNPLSTFWQYRFLIGQLTRRDVVLKYRGSVLGIGWSFFHPLLLLAAFTLVFGGVLGTRWGGTGSGLEFALFIYCGLLVFTPFSEVVGAAPRLLYGYQSYVKKIVFPTEILPLVAVLAATVHGVANLALLAVAVMLSGHGHWTLLLMPLVLLPAWLFTLGLAWLLAAAGAYMRDLAHAMPVLTQVLMFLSPVFYPMDAAPPALRGLHLANPLAMAMEDVRRAALEGLPPRWDLWLAMIAVGLAAALLGHAFFRSAKEEFADVL